MLVYFIRFRRAQFKMNTVKNEMLSVEDVSTALKISKSQVYKVLKKNRNIIKPMIKIDGKNLYF